jgi:uncharacterized protein YciI
MKYFAQCFVNPIKNSDLKTLREAHIEYIEKFSSLIIYGGVCGNNDMPYQSICFFLNVESEQEALNFVNQDPYSTTYSSVEIKKFTQKIPN